jgi:hypothetical protein
VIKKKIIDPTRVRKISGGFAFIPHRFLADEFLAALTKNEMLLYLFLVMAADRYGLSFYSYDAICMLTHLTLEQYIEARNELITKSLIAFDGTLFQVLELPDSLACAKPKERPDAKRLAALAQKAVKGF